MNTKTISLSEVKAGRFYSWVYHPSCEEMVRGKKLNKGGRAGVAPNPLFGRVNVRRVYRGQAWTVDTYINAMSKLRGEPYEIAPTDAKPKHKPTSNPCVVEACETGEKQVRIGNFSVTKEEWFVDGRLATAEEMAVIEAYKPARGERGDYVPLMTPALNNLENCEE